MSDYSPKPNSMQPPVDHTRCRANVHGEFDRFFSQCRNRPQKGKKYCHLHDPEVKKARASRQRSIDEAQIRLRDLKSQEQSTSSRLVDAVLEQTYDDDGPLNPECWRLVEEVRRLRQEIEEARRTYNREKF